MNSHAPDDSPPSFLFLPTGSTIVGFAPAGTAPLDPQPNIPIGISARQRGTVLGVVPDGGLTVHLQRPPDVAADAATADLVNAWEDDPANLAVARRPVPDLTRAPAVNIAEPAPPPAQYKPGTREFRYWQAAEALGRSVEFWRGILGTWRWRIDGSETALPVQLDAPGADFNAYYDRTAIRFFHADGGDGMVYSAESPDIVCHELGHAVLDSIKPQLWNAASHEASAFHESFGDISAILSALQLPELRESVLRTTGGRLYTNSRLSRLAEQLGAAIRRLNPQAVDPDCLRNAVNAFTYADPNLLPHMAPAAYLSSEPHSFSRVFTGAFLESLAAMLTATAQHPQRPTETELMTTAQTMARLLVEAICGGPRAAVLRTVFLRRNLLSPRSVARVARQRPAAATLLARKLDPPPDIPLGMMLLDARAYGIADPLGLEAPTHHRSFAATSAGADATSLDPSSALAAARSFADDLVRRGRVDFAALGDDTPLLHFGQRFNTHRLVSDDATIVLHRCCFDCGLYRD